LDAGNVQYDAGSHMVLADVQTRDVVTVIDPKANRVVRVVSLPGCNHDHGLLVDAPRRLAYVACDGNAKLHTLDLRTWKVTGTDDVGDDPHVLAFDSSLRRSYVAAESGVVAVFDERGRTLVKHGQSFLARSAHSVAVESRTHRVYLPLERGSNGRPQLLVMAPR
jgi:DNA-binding beta-propeller fold protein YncE